MGAALKLLFALCALLICVGCASPENSIPLSTKEFGAPDNTLFVQGNELRISPLDVLDIKVFGSSNLDGSYQVDPDGNIKFPLVGAAEAKGHTTFEFATVLEGKLREKYLQNPQVTVRVSEFNGQQFTVEGAIGKPGMYPVRGSLTLMQALALSGGPSGSANLGGILIFRTIEGKRLAARFDLRKIRIGQSVDPVVYGNDLIVVVDRDGGAYEQVLRSMPILGIFGGLF